MSQINRMTIKEFYEAIKIYGQRQLFIMDRIQSSYAYFRRHFLIIAIMKKYIYTFFT